MDPQAWLDRWDAQQTRYVPEREERFAVITDVVAAVAGERPRVLDLGCGPGSLALRLLDRLPGAQVVAVDADPVLMALGQGAAAGRAGLSWADLDLRDPSWSDRLPGPYDAAVSTTALHWLPASRLPAFYAQLAGLLRPGAVFVDGDHFGYPPESGLAALGKALRAGWDERAPAPPADDWDGWWAALEREPDVAGAFADRARRRHEHPAADESDLFATHRNALLGAGFAEVGTVWQRGTDRVLVALRRAEDPGNGHPGYGVSQGEGQGV
jgi:SAM-dependent methyltransferase